MKKKSLHILHIANSYGGTEVYTNLIRSLDQLGVRQTVFVPLNSNNHNRKGSQLIPFSVSNSIIFYSTALKHYHRFMYDKKIKTIKHEIERYVDLNSISLIHAGLFCSDGAVAFELFKEYNIPYIVAVRNTDVNLYYKKLWWKRSYFYLILKNAKSIVFISPQYKRSFFKELGYKKSGNIDIKSIVIPNGVDSFYLENRIMYVKELHSPIRVVYAGAFNRGKNILEIIFALDSLVQKGYKINFSAIGRGLSFRKEDEDYLNTIQRIASEKTWIEILDCMPKEKLRNVFENSDIFVMPSIPETFGVVYVEALSQGLPIIYTNGQGFDGYYNDRNIGFGVNPKDANEIAEKIGLIINNYPQLSLNVSQLNLEEDFSWAKISERYIHLYKNAI
ncbi:MAG: glycosyltransferase family 4 protein [Bacteroidales bacterium]|nr:glycosyltransferase family 4 protein [Bacteroidales bacterium]